MLISLIVANIPQCIYQNIKLNTVNYTSVKLKTGFPKSKRVIHSHTDQR